MRLSFLGKSYNTSMPTSEAFKTSEAVSVKRQSDARNSFHTAQRQQPTTLTYRSAAGGNQTVQPPATPKLYKTAAPKLYKTVAVHWIAVNNSPTSKTFSAVATSRPSQFESREIEINLPQIDAMSKLLLFIQMEDTCGTTSPQVYKSRVVKIDQAAKKALIQISSLEGSTDWTDNLKLKLVPVNSISR